MFNYQTIKRRSLSSTLLLIKDKSKKNSIELVLTTLTIIIFGIFAIKPTFTTIAELNQNIETQTIILEELQEKTLKLSMVKSEIERESTKLPIINQAIPNEAKLSELMIQITSLASESEVAINNINFSNYNPKEYVKNTPTGSSDSTTPQWGEVTLMIDVTGDFSKLRNFWDKFENLRRLIITDSIQFKIDDSTEELRLLVNSRVIFHPIK